MAYCLSQPDTESQCLVTTKHACRRVKTRIQIDLMRMIQKQWQVYIISLEVMLCLGSNGFLSQQTCMDNASTYFYKYLLKMFNMPLSPQIPLNIIQNSLYTYNVAT